MRFGFKIHDEAGGLEVTAAATSPAGINTRSIDDPVGLVFRTFDRKNANSGFRRSGVG
jgi:hypothetical protein